MAKAPSPDVQMAGQISIWIAVLLTFQVFGRLGARAAGMDKASQAGTAFAVSCGNTAFLGTAVLTSLMGPSILPLVAAFVAVENIVVVALGAAGLKQSGQGQADWAVTAKAILNGLTNPTSVGALIGFLISLSGLQVPPPLLRPLEMLGAAASPAGLVALGIVMATLSPSHVYYWRGTALIVALKNVLLPVSMFGAFTVSNAPTDVTIAATLLAACPSAVNVFIQARQADIWAEAAAKAVFVTTLVSIIGVSVVAALATA